MWWIVAGYVVMGFIKLRAWDRNGEGGWLAMMADQRNMHISTWFVLPVLVLSILSWPIALFTTRFSIAWLCFIIQWRHLPEWYYRWRYNQK